MTSYWLQNGMGAKHTIVDLGPLDDQSARDRADKLLNHLSRRNIQIVGQRRLTAYLPPEKHDAVLQALPAIREGGAGYCWCTHSWLAGLRTEVVR